jgi:hypothetical protein
MSKAEEYGLLLQRCQPHVPLESYCFFWILFPSSIVNQVAIGNVGRENARILPQHDVAVVVQMLM